MQGGIFEPVWSCGPILPPSLVGLWEKTAEEVEEVEEDEEEAIVYDELLMMMIWYTVAWCKRDITYGFYRLFCYMLDENGS